MKHTILEALKTRYAGVAESILDRIADNLAKTVTDEADVANAVDGAFKDVLTAYGDKRATDATKTAVANYERKHGLKDGKAVDGGEPVNEPVNEPVKEPAASDDTPAWAKQLIEANKSLKERLDRMDGERMQQSRKSIIDTIIEPLPASLRKAYQRQPLASMSEDEFTELQETIKAEVEEISGEMSAKGAVFGKPATTGKQGNVQAATDKEADDVVQMMHF